MNFQRPFGLCLYQKDRKDLQVLKDLLQLLKVRSPGKCQSFAYVEAEHSLIPRLSLWENVQIVSGGTSWKEFIESANPECEALLRLLTNPEKMAEVAAPWERLAISLLKGLVTPGRHLLIDINEDLLSPLMVQNFKKTILRACHERQIFLASASSALWLDCAHSLVRRQNHDFITESLDAENLKKHWAA